MFSIGKVKEVLFFVSVLIFSGFLFSSLGSDAYAIGPSNGGWNSGFSATQSSTGGLSDAPISVVVATFMRWLLYLVGFLAVIAFVISGILYLTAAGDDERIERAKTTMIYAIVGVIVALMGLIIVNAVDSWLGGATAQF